MDSCARIPVEPKYPILVEVSHALLRLEHPETSARRIARQGDTLHGIRQLIAHEAWIIFEDGYGIRERRLKEAWDNLEVEVCIHTQEGGIEELFT